MVRAILAWYCAILIKQTIIDGARSSKCKHTMWRAFKGLSFEGQSWLKPDWLSQYSEQFYTREVPVIDQVRRMKRFLYIAVILLVAASGCIDDEGSSYSISGIVENFEAGNQVILFRFDPVTQDRTGVDTAQISADGRYRLQFELPYPDLFRIDFPDRQRIMLAIDRDQHSITINAEGKRNGAVTIEGSPSSTLLLEYDKVRSESYDRLVEPPYAAMREARDSGNTDHEIEGVKAYVEASKAHRRELLDFTAERIGGSLALYGTMLRWTGDDEVDRLESLVSQFESNYNNMPAALAMRQKLERYKKVAIGATAPPIEGPTPAGTTLSLQDVDARYTLIDFWASWCSPCISQVPDLHKVYASFHDKGFEILSVSVDTKDDKWRAAIDRYDLDWLHISDLKGWQSPLANNYNVTFVPYNFLVDQDGTIVAKNLHSKELYSTLDELLKGAL